MQKLANISTFENLQYHAHKEMGMVGGMAVFNDGQPEQVLRHLSTRALNHLRKSVKFTQDSAQIDWLSNIARTFFYELLYPVSLGEIFTAGYKSDLGRSLVATMKYTLSQLYQEAKHTSPEVASALATVMSTASDGDYINAFDAFLR